MRNFSNNFFFIFNYSIFTPIKYYTLEMLLILIILNHIYLLQINKQ